MFQMAGGTQRAQLCPGIVWIVVDVRGVQMDKVQVVVMLAHPHDAVWETALFAAIARLLQASLRTALGLRIAVTRVSRGELPRFEMKAQRWIRRP